jgi:RNA polymerase sigma factor (sigma-70 family)
MDSTRSDAQLVEAARNGHKHAFSALVGRHYPLVLALCRRALGDLGLAEDAAQEATLQAMLSLDRLKQADRFEAWFVAIGLNMCHRLRRQRAHDAWSWEAVLGGRLVDGLVEMRPGPEEMAEAAELRAQVQRAVADLPPGQRAAVLHFYLAGLTHAETAALLGINIGAVKTRLHKARRSLRRQLSVTWKENTMDEKLSRRTLTKGAGALAGAATVGKIAPKTAAGESAVEMRVRDVRRYRAANNSEFMHVALLEGVHDARVLPIWMCEFEATAIALHLEGVATPRPLAYAFAAGLLQATGGQLREVRINRLEDSVFYAMAVVEGSEGLMTVDARPSDALNLALLARVPIRVDSAILEAILEAPRSGPRWDTEDAEDAAGLAAHATAKWSGPPSDR